MIERMRVSQMLRFPFQAWTVLRFGVALKDLAAKLRLLAEDVDAGASSMGPVTELIDHGAIAQKQVSCLIGFSRVFK